MTETERIIHDGLTKLKRLDEHGGHISDSLTHAVLYDDSGPKNPGTGVEIDYIVFEYLKAEDFISALPDGTLGPKGNYRITDAGRRYYRARESGEREPNIYQRISNYAAEQGIKLDEGYVVWVVQGDTVMRSGEVGGRLVFPDQTTATTFAEKHSPKVRVFITGPVNKQYIEITTRTK